MHYNLYGFSNEESNRTDGRLKTNTNDICKKKTKNVLWKIFWEKLSTHMLKCEFDRSWMTSYSVLFQRYFTEIKADYLGHILCCYEIGRMWKYTSSVSMKFTSGLTSLQRQRRGLLKLAMMLKIHNGVQIIRPERSRRTVESFELHGMNVIRIGSEDDFAHTG